MQNFCKNPSNRPCVGFPAPYRNRDGGWNVCRVCAHFCFIAHLQASEIRLRVARFQRPNVWDVAGGIPLVLATGGEVHVGAAGGNWSPLERLEASTDPAGGEPELRNWRRPLILGDA